MFKNFLFYVIVLFLIKKNVCNSEPEKKHMCRRVSVPNGQPIFINLNEKILESIWIRNIGRDDVNVAIMIPKENEPLKKSVVKNDTSINIVFANFLEKSIDESDLRLVNEKTETAIVYITVWYWQKSKIDYISSHSVIIPPIDNHQVIFKRLIDTCETPVLEKTNLTWYEKYTNNLSIRDYTIMAVNMIPFLGPVISPLMEVFWLYPNLYGNSAGPFQSIIKDLNNFIDKWNHKNLKMKMDVYLLELKEKLITIDILLNQTCVMSRKNLSTSDKITLKLMHENIVEQYKDFVYYLNGREVKFMPEERRRFYFLEMTYHVIDLQLRVFNLAIVQTDSTRNQTKQMKDINCKLPFLEAQKDKLFIDDVKHFLSMSVQNYNNYVQNMIDNMYQYAYEDSLFDENVYNAVARAHNYILQYGVRPIQTIVETFFKHYNMTVNFKVVDFPRPYLYFAPLIGMPTLESSIKASSLVEDLYNDITHSIYRSVRQMVVQKNFKGDLVGIMNYDAEVPSSIDSKLFNFDSTRHNPTNRFDIRIPLTSYIDKAEICVQQIGESLTKVVLMKIHVSKKDWIDIISLNVTTSKCNIYEMENHSVNRIIVFSDICFSDGAAVNAAVVFKKLDDFNHLLNE